MEFSSRCVYYNASRLLSYSTPTPLSSQSLPFPSHNHLVPAHGACLVTHSREGRLSEIPGRKMSNQYLVRSHNDGNKLFIKTFHGRPSSKHSRDAFLGTWWRWLPACSRFYEQRAAKVLRRSGHELFQSTNLWRHKREFNYIIKSASSFQFKWARRRVRHEDT